MRACVYVGEVARTDAAVAAAPVVAVARPVAARKQFAPGSLAELALVKRARGGDTEAMADLYRGYARPVHAALLARIGDAHAAEDAVHDVFEAAMRHLPDLRDPQRFGPWLLTIARRKATDVHRRRQPTVPLKSEPGVSAPPRLEAAEVLDAIASMPSAYRETLAMRLIEGMTGPEIAAATGRSAISVRVNLHRGMRRLRASLTGGE